MSSTSDPPAVPTRRDISKTLSATKNLRAISMSLVEKLRIQAGVSSIDIATELATEAISEVAGGAVVVSDEDLQAVGKNIRRRLYDSLKVLESIGAIVRTRKDKTLTWVGTNHLIPHRFQANQSLVPHDPSSETVALSQSVVQLRKGILSKGAELSQLKAQSRALLNLCRRNQRFPSPEPIRIHMPFVVIRTPVSTEIRLDATPDAHSIAFEFHGYYEIVNDASILDRMFLVSDTVTAVERFHRESTNDASVACDALHTMSGLLRRVEGDPFSSPKRRRVASRSPFAKFTSGCKPPLSPGTPLRQGALVRKQRDPACASAPQASTRALTKPSDGNETICHFDSPSRSALCAPPRKRRVDYEKAYNDSAQGEADAAAGSRKGFLRRTYGPKLRRANAEKGNGDDELLKALTATEITTTEIAPTW